MLPFLPVGTDLLWYVYASTAEQKFEILEAEENRMQELVRLNKSGFLPLLGAGSFWGRKETKVCPGEGGCSDVTAATRIDF